MKLLPALILALVCCVSICGQTVDEGDVIRVDTDVTNLPFTASDKQHRFITNLKADDVRVLEDGVAQQVSVFQQETDRPLAIAFLIDISQSQENVLPLEKEAARSFIENVIKSNKDLASIIPFTGSAYLEQMFTRDVLSLYHVLERVEPALPTYMGAGRPLSGIESRPGMSAPPEEGTTAIWEAISLTSYDVMVKAAGQRRRVIILLSDGWDTSSRIPKKDAIDASLSAETVIYSIGIGDSKHEGINRDALKDIAEHTGGRAFFPKTESDLQTAFASIEQELRTQYLIAYSSSNKKHDGAYRKITLELTNPDLKKDKIELRHRPGYFAKKK